MSSYVGEFAAMGTALCWSFGSIFFTVSSLLGGRFVSMAVFMVLEKIGYKKAWYRVGFVSWGALMAAILSSGLFFILV